MAVITVGAAAIDRAANHVANYTYVSLDGPADGTGIITSVSLYVQLGGTFEVAIWTNVGVNTYTTRSNASLGVLGTGLQTVNGLSLAVVAGDFIGTYSADGRIDRDNSGGAGVGYKLGDSIPGTNVVMSAAANYLSSIQGTGATIAPAITLLNPDHGAVGDSVTITGTTFEAAQGSGTVTFNGVPATVTAWSDTSITVTVPVGATTGNVVVTNNTGDASAGVTWTLDAVAPAATSGTTPALGQQLQGLSAGAVLGQPSVQA